MELEDLSYTASTLSPRAAAATEAPPATPFQAVDADAPRTAAVEDGREQQPQGLSSQPWLRAIIEAPGSRVVFNSGGADLSSSQLAGVSADHLFLSLLDHHLIKDMVVVYDARSRTLVNALRLGVPVCGHPKLVHGGLTSAILDETFGALLYSMRRKGQVSFNRVFTARLEVDYTTPLPAESVVVCRAAVRSFEGRKLWLAASVEAPPAMLGGACDGSGTDGGGTEGCAGVGGAAAVVYARSKSLFVIPREDAGGSAVAAAGGGGGGAASVPHGLGSSSGAGE